MSSSFDYLLKIIIIGDSSVGKSNILAVYNDGKFNENLQPSIGVEFIAKNIEIENTKFRLQIWDTAGQESFLSMTKVYYKNSCCAFIVYDITEKKSFDHVEFWLNELKNEAPESILYVLIGNKSDLYEKRVISFEQGSDYAKKHKMMFFETSARNKIDIDNIFKETVKRINKNIKEGVYNLDDDSCGVKLCNSRKNVNIEDFDVDLSTIGENKKKKKKCCK
jgi:small GTP-binding protein